ncbi:hypothetical protein FCV25MIE_15720 [Fagus crenata]
MTFLTFGSNLLSSILKYCGISQQGSRKSLDDQLQTSYSVAKVMSGDDLLMEILLRLPPLLKSNLFPSGGVLSSPASSSVSVGDVSPGPAFYCPISRISHSSHSRNSGPA